MRVINKFLTPLLTASIAALSVGCSSGGGQANQTKVADTSATDRAALAKQLASQREAAERAKDQAINGGGPSTSVRYGDARANSMTGTSAYNASSVPQTPYKPAVSSSSNNNSTLLVAGLAVFALFGKPIMEGVSAGVSAASDGVKSALGSDSSTKTATKIAKENNSLASKLPIIEEKDVTGDGVKSTAPQVAARPPNPDPEVKSGDGATDRKVVIKNCPPDTSSNARSISGLLEGISQNLESGVKS